MGLRTKLSISYVLVILICVVIIIVLSNAVLENQFRAYVTGQQKQQALNTVSLITQSYNEAEEWDVFAIEDIGINALDNGLIIKVADTQGAVIWDARAHNSGMCQQMLTQMSRNMQSRYGNWEGGYEENSYDVNSGGQKVGTVSVGYYGPFFYTESDLYFINTINSLILWAGVISAILALIIGFFISRQISGPISRVIGKAQRIAKGSYGEKVIEKSGTTEIKLLVDTINKLADTLKKQEEMSVQASNDIAHELRTPLTTIQGNLEAVMDGVMELDADRIKVLYDEVQRINRLVEDLAKLARFEREDAALIKTQFDISVSIADIVNNYRSDFEREGKSLTFAAGKQIITADEDKIKQVMINLLSNALKYTREGDSTEVLLKGNAKQVVITVRDTGMGIHKDDLPYIFDRFYRADKSRSRKTGGAGIGLAIVKSIVSAHGGTILVDSRPGLGTEFIVTLPKLS